MKNGVKMFEQASVGGLMCSTSAAGKAEEGSNIGFTDPISLQAR